LAWPSRHNGTQQGHHADANDLSIANEVALFATMCDTSSAATAVSFGMLNYIILASIAALLTAALLP
jgi:hypothetical protein